MEKKILILEDNPSHYNLIKEGVKASKHIFHIYEMNLKELTNNIKINKSVETIPEDIDLFIIDVSLKLDEDHNEFGLQFLLELKAKYSRNFAYIITSIWDRSEFQLVTNIEECNFINKNNHQGFELEFKVRHKLNLLWEK